MHSILWEAHLSLCVSCAYFLTLGEDMAVSVGCTARAAKTERIMQGCCHDKFQQAVCLKSVRFAISGELESLTQKAWTL